MSCQVEMREGAAAVLRIFDDLRRAGTHRSGSDVFPCLPCGMAFPFPFAPARCSRVYVAIRMMPGRSRTMLMMRTVWKTEAVKASAPISSA